MVNSCEIIKTALNKFHKTDKLEYIKKQTANFQRK